MIQITLRKAYNMGFKHEFSIAIITVTPFINVFIGVCVGGSCIKLTKIWDLNSLKCVFELMMAIWCPTMRRSAICYSSVENRAAYRV